MIFQAFYIILFWQVINQSFNYEYIGSTIALLTFSKAIIRVKVKIGENYRHSCIQLVSYLDLAHFHFFDFIYRPKVHHPKLWRPNIRSHIHVRIVRSPWTFLAIECISFSCHRSASFISSVARCSCFSPPHLQHFWSCWSMGQLRTRRLEVVYVVQPSIAVKCDFVLVWRRSKPEFHCVSFVHGLPYV